MNTLDRIVESSLRSLHSDLANTNWRGREREIVSLFVFAHLLPLANADSALFDPAQIGIEVAVPQVKAGVRVKRDVCKDVVIWPRPKMTCWDLSSPYPLAVIEWKSLNLQDDERARRHKLTEFQDDVSWLEQTSKLSEEFTGFAVLVTQAPENIEVGCSRVRHGLVESNWIALSGAKVRSHHA